MTKTISVQNYNSTTMLIQLEPIGGAFELPPMGVITIESSRGYDMGDKIDIVPDGNDLMISVGGPYWDFFATLVVKLDGVETTTI